MSFGSLFARVDVRQVLLVGPAVLLLLLTCYYPLAWIALQAFTKAGVASTATLVEVATSRLFISSAMNTAYLTGSVVLVTALIGYPLAYMVHNAPPGMGNILKFLILFPFWTSTLVRTYAWVVILQRDGLLVGAIRSVFPGLAPVSFLNSHTASVIGMVHILLPFFVFPLLASMAGIRTEYMKAAMSLGASPSAAFWTVFFPLSLPGLVASSVMVLMLSVGFYVIPIVLGGGKAPVISMVIERSLSLFPDWAVASAMGLLLLAICTLALLLLTSLAAGAQRLWR